VRPGRDTSRALIEVAAMDQKLKGLGQNSAVDFNHQTAQFNGAKIHKWACLAVEGALPRRVKKLKRDVPVINRLGLHARPAAMFVSHCQPLPGPKFGCPRKAKK